MGKILIGNILVGKVLGGNKRWAKYFVGNATGRQSTIDLKSQTALYTIDQNIRNSESPKMITYNDMR